jgi:hypothetical protein
MSASRKCATLSPRELCQTWRIVAAANRTRTCVTRISASCRARILLRASSPTIRPSVRRSQAAGLWGGLPSCRRCGDLGTWRCVLGARVRGAISGRRDVRSQRQVLGCVGRPVAKTLERFQDEATVTSTWTFNTTCPNPFRCTGQVSSDQGWTVALHQRISRDEFDAARLSGQGEGSPPGHFWNGAEVLLDADN